MPFLDSRFRLLSLRLALCSAMMLALCLLLSCKHGGPLGGGEVMYVSAPQANLRDHVATIYSRVGTVKNGDRVEVLERQRRFVRVRTAQKVEGWIELRALVPGEVFEQFQQLGKDNRDTPTEGHGLTRTELNMHVSPGRETDTLYQLGEGAKVEMLKRATAVRATREEIAAIRAAALAHATGEAVKAPPKKRARAKAAPPKTPGAEPRPEMTPESKSESKSAQPAASGAPPPPEAEESAPKPMDDWWLVRDQKGDTGWVLARMVDLDIPLDVVQYAEGQRIQAAFVLDTVQDEEKGAIPQYLVLLNEDRDGVAYDFNQVRVFTWNLRKHRYETAYREHYIMGYFPARVSTEDFGKEGTMPVFTLREQNEDGSIGERKFRLIGNIVRPLLAPGEVPPHAAHSPGEPRRDLKEKKSAHGKGGGRHEKKR